MQLNGTNFQVRTRLTPPPPLRLRSFPKASSPLHSNQWRFLLLHSVCKFSTRIVLLRADALSITLVGPQSRPATLLGTRTRSITFFNMLSSGYDPTGSRTGAHNLFDCSYSLACLACLPCVSSLLAVVKSWPLCHFVHVGHTAPIRVPSV